MKIMYFAILASVAAGAYGAQSTDATGSYETDLGQVHGAILAIKVVKELCAESFPEFADPNDLAYTKWFAQYQAVFQEVERHVIALAHRKAKLVSSSAGEILEESHRIAKEQLRKLYEGLGANAFKVTCLQYPTYLTEAARADIPSYFAQQLKTIRRGPKKEKQ